MSFWNIYNHLDMIRTVFFLRKKRRAGKVFFWSEGIFFKKTKGFPKKNTLAPKKTFPARLFFRRKKTVRIMSKWL